MCPFHLQVQGSLLPALAKLALDSDAGIRDAAQGAMVVFAVKAGNVGVLDKVGMIALLAGWHPACLPHASFGRQVCTAPCQTTRRAMLPASFCICVAGVRGGMEGDNDMARVCYIMLGRGASVK